MKKWHLGYMWNQLLNWGRDLWTVQAERGTEALSSWELGPRVGHAAGEMRQVLPFAKGSIKMYYPSKVNLSILHYILQEKSFSYEFWRNSSSVRILGSWCSGGKSTHFISTLDFLNTHLVYISMFSNNISCKTKV